MQSSSAAPLIADFSTHLEVPYAELIQELPQRVLPFANSDAVAVNSSYLHMASCVGFETRGRNNPFHLNNNSRQDNIYLLKLTLAGTGYLDDLDTGRTHSISPGSAILLPFPSNTAYYCESGKNWTFIWACFIGDPTTQLCSQITRKHGYVFDFRSFPSVLKSMINLYQHRLENPQYDVYHVSEIVYRMLMLILQHQESSLPRLPASILNACEYMQASIGNSNLSIEGIASKMGYSKYHFTRKFRQHMRMGPHQYLTKIRLDKAVDLITTTDLPMKIISERIGFREITHFYNVFKKHMKMTPGSLNRPPH